MSKLSVKVEHITKPSSTREIDMGELQALLTERFPGVSTENFYLSDARNYKLCNLKDINRFLKADATDRAKYTAERLDCDDFAFRLMGQFSVPDWSDLCIGLVWTSAHALNCLIDQNEDFWFVEPQTDELLPKLKQWMGTLRFIII